MKRYITLFLEDILDSINAIEKFSENIDREELDSNRLKQSAIIREIEIIGEATKNIPENFRKIYPNVEWKKIAGLRDIIIHAYFEIDLDIVWKVIKKDFPELKIKILKIKEDLTKS